MYEEYIDYNKLFSLTRVRLKKLKNYIRSQIMTLTEIFNDVMKNH